MEHFPRTVVPSLEDGFIDFDVSDSPPGYGVLHFLWRDLVLPFLTGKARDHLANATICRKGKSYLSSSKTKQVIL